MEGEAEEGTYFVDQAGHYYFQAKGDSQPVMTVMSTIPQQPSDEGEEFIINQEPEENEAVEEPEEVGYYFSLMKFHWNLDVVTLKLAFFLCFGGVH